MYADDTASLSAGATLELATGRAQRAADILAQWSRDWKMSIAGEKTQVLCLSQTASDKNITVRVDGTEVKGASHLNLLGVKLDRLLHFGEHCSSLRQKVRPRTTQLRHMTGRSWGLREAQLRAVANGYVRGALEYAAGAWLPAASDSHVAVVNREVLAAARVVTGCPVSTPCDALLAEAGMLPAHTRRRVVAARMFCRAVSLPEADPLRTVAESSVRRRLRTTGWRDIGRAALAEAGAADAVVEQRLLTPPAPWNSPEGVHIALDVGPGGERRAHPDVRRRAAEACLAALPTDATWVWSDGSAEDGVANGGGGATIAVASGETREVRVPAGALCSSTRAELFALRAALSELRSMK